MRWWIRQTRVRRDGWGCHPRAIFSILQEDQNISSATLQEKELVDHLSSPPPPAMAHTHETIGNPLRWDFSWPSWGHRSWTSDNWQRCVISSEPGNTPLMFPLMTFRHIGSGLRFTVTTSRWRCRSCMHSKRKPRFHCQRNSNSTKQAYQEKLLAESWIRHFGQKTLGLLFLWCLAHKGL